LYCHAVSVIECNAVKTFEIYPVLFQCIFVHFKRELRKHIKKYFGFISVIDGLIKFGLFSLYSLKNIQKHIKKYFGFISVIDDLIKFRMFSL
jgi:hypothetical protein